jgi:hypothetical protein
MKRKTKPIAPGFCWSPQRKVFVFLKARGTIRSKRVFFYLIVDTMRKALRDLRGEESQWRND